MFNEVKTDGKVQKEISLRSENFGCQKTSFRVHFSLGIEEKKLKFITKKLLKLLKVIYILETVFPVWRVLMNYRVV